MEENHTKVEKQEDFADFSRFESFVEAQGAGGVVRRGSSPRPAQHRRSFSLDHSRVRLFTWIFVVIILDYLSGISKGVLMATLTV